MDRTFRSRRSLLKVTGASAALLLAGCAGPESDDGEDGENGDGAPGDNETGTGDENETDGNETDGNETDGNETDGNETDDGTGGADGDWQDVDEIVLDGYTEAWEGVEPAPIEGEDNPTLTLVEGQEYDITWENADGQPHNIALYDENDEVVEDYQTENITEEGETQTLTFEATPEIVTYICEVHPNTMIGDVEVESDGGGGGNETDGNQSDDNQTGENDTAGNESGE